MIAFLYGSNNPQVSKGAIEGMEKLVVEETIHQFGEKVVLPHDVVWPSEKSKSIIHLFIPINSFKIIDNSFNSFII